MPTFHVGFIIGILLLIFSCISLYGSTFFFSPPPMRLSFTTAPRLPKTFQDVEPICHEGPLDEIWSHNLSHPKPFLYPHCTDRTRRNASRSEGPVIEDLHGWPSSGKIHPFPAFRCR